MRIFQFLQCTIYTRQFGRSVNRNFVVGQAFQPDSAASVRLESLTYGLLPSNLSIFRKKVAVSAQVSLPGAFGGYKLARAAETGKAGRFVDAGISSVFTVRPLPRRPTPLFGRARFRGSPQLPNLGTNSSPKSETPGGGRRAFSFTAQSPKASLRACGVLAQISVFPN
jgi:hypothetical protein